MRGEMFPPTFTANRIPASAAKADPIMNVTAITQLTLTPMSEAVSWSWAQARMARPVRVLATR